MVSHAHVRQLTVSFKSSPSLPLVPLWFILLSKLFFSGCLQFKCYFLPGQITQNNVTTLYESNLFTSHFFPVITYRQPRIAGKPGAAHIIDRILQSRTPYARPANITSAKVHEYHSDVPAT